MFADESIDDEPDDNDDMDNFFRPLSFWLFLSFSLISRFCLRHFARRFLNQTFKHNNLILKIGLGISFSFYKKISCTTRNSMFIFFKTNQLENSCHTYFRHIFKLKKNKTPLFFNRWGKSST
jgi:hypothetical protein